VVTSGTYRALLRHSIARRQAASGLLAQVTQGAASVAIILVVRAETGSLTLAVTGGGSALTAAITQRRGTQAAFAVAAIAGAAAAVLTFSTRPILDRSSVEGTS
jgi:hypothetical protein